VPQSSAPPHESVQAAPESSAVDVGLAYLEVHHKMFRLVDEAMTATGLSLSRAKLLKELAEHGPMNQAALAQRLGHAPRSVTDIVDSLERDGLAVRADDPSDRRARIVQMTPAGSAALDRALEARIRIFDQIFGALDAPGRAQLVSLLRVVGRSLQSSSGGCFDN
jgi:DNA-binding MarR family transcriptional regulator